MFANLHTVPSLLQEMKRQDPDFPDVSSGVFVYEVIQGSAAASSGLRDHDVIVSINGQPVTTTTDVIEAVKDNAFLSIIVLRGSQTLFLTVTPSSECHNPLTRSSSGSICSGKACQLAVTSNT